ncbi:MAG: Unknown protein [uncultured Sulfurovum sp.]|uniref:Uncharacterized protein n=1 Tax=uncultured Sulfurovum sp. TaxID=269237 RepID=A0A6S6U8H0_9BACT|nr:MAG: Unknown protein [uncultured Sulfurovum sp.]
MKKYFLLPLLFFLLNSCTKEPIIPSAKEEMAKQIINENIHHANIAKREYMTLQKKRINE